EASLPAVLAGQVPTESGFSTLRAVERSVVTEALREVVRAVEVPVVVHCCAPDVPLAVIRDAGAVAVALDLDLLDDLDPVGEAVAGRIRRRWARRGSPAERLATQVVVTQACGLAGATPDYARGALAAGREAARQLRNG